MSVTARDRWLSKFEAPALGFGKASRPRALRHMVKLQDQIEAAGYDPAELCSEAVDARARTHDAVDDGEDDELEPVETPAETKQREQRSADRMTLMMTRTKAATAAAKAAGHTLNELFDDRGSLEGWETRLAALKEKGGRR